MAVSVLVLPDVGYSAVVRGWLVVEKEELPLAPTFCILRESRKSIPEIGQVVVEIDGHRSIRNLLDLKISGEDPCTILFTREQARN